MITPRPIKIVLLPGLDGTGKLFAPFTNQLPDFVVPYVISYPSDRSLSLNELSAWVQSKLPEGDFVLLAESFSGLVALRLLPQIVSRLQALIFVGAFASSPRPLLLKFCTLFSLTARYSAQLPHFLIRLFCLGHGASKKTCQEFQTILMEVPRHILVQRLSIIAAAKPPELIAIECACYYIEAKADRLVPSNAVRWFRENIRNLQVVQVSAPHFMLQTKPKECVEKIKKVLELLV